MADYQSDIDDWNQQLNTYALNFGDIHRDFYAFPLLQRPADVSQLDKQQELHRKFALSLNELAVLFGALSRRKK